MKAKLCDVLPKDDHRLFDAIGSRSSFSVNPRGQVHDFPHRVKEGSLRCKRAASQVREGRGHRSKVSGFCFLRTRFVLRLQELVWTQVKHQVTSEVVSHLKDKPRNSSSGLECIWPDIDVSCM